MSENVLAKIPSTDLAVHVVWTPVLPTDNEDEAIHADHLVPDERTIFYWDGAQDLGLSYGRTIELPRGRQLAWDIYFVYGPDAEWNETVPLPTEWNHQLADDERYLGDGAKLRTAIEGLLTEMK